MLQLACNTLAFPFEECAACICKLGSFPVQEQGCYLMQMGLMHRREIKLPDPYGVSPFSYALLLIQLFLIIFCNGYATLGMYFIFSVFLIFKTLSKLNILD